MNDDEIRACISLENRLNVLMKSRHNTEWVIIQAKNLDRSQVEIDFLNAYLDNIDKQIKEVSDKIRLLKFIDKL